MPRKIYFITGNIGKFKEVKEILRPLEVKQLDLDLPEIQEIDSKKIIEDKLSRACEYYKDNEKINEFFVEDTSLEIFSLKGLPGSLVKWFLKTLGNKGIYNLVEDNKDKGAIAKTLIGYKNQEGEIHFFKGILDGRISSPKGEGFGWDPIFVPRGYEKTFGQMDEKEKNKISMRKQALQQFKEHLKETSKKD